MIASRKAESLRLQFFWTAFQVASPLNIHSLTGAGNTGGWGTGLQEGRLNRARDGARTAGKVINYCILFEKIAATTQNKAAACL